VRVVAHQQIQATWLGGGAEVLEQLLGLAGAVSGGLAQRGGERLRAGGVPGPVARAQRLAEQGQGEGALAGAGAAGDHEGRRAACFGGEELAHMVEDGVLVLGQREHVGIGQRGCCGVEQRVCRGVRG
jgi:hypothetical protein